MTEPVVARDVAEREFTRFAEMMDLGFNIEKMNEEEREQFVTLRERFISSIERGQLVVDELGQPIVTTHDGKTYTFREPTGETILQIQRDGLSGASANQRAFGMMTQKPPVEYAKLLHRDLRVVNAVLTLFFG
jgi:hypothetical protein